MNDHSGVTVHGAGGPSCEGQFVYYDSESELTLAEDDRAGAPIYVVEHFVYGDRCEVRYATQAELQRWQSKRRVNA